MSWPDNNTTRFHDAALRVCPVYQIKIGNHIKWAFSREEMLLFDPSLWHKRYAYILRAPQDITPANLTGDFLLDRPEWGIPIYRNSTWDVLSNKPLDGNPVPVARALGTPPQLLLEAGVVPIYVPDQALVGDAKGFEISHKGSKTMLGYGWLINTTTRHNRVTRTIPGSTVTHKFEFGLAGGGGIYSWEISDATLGVTRNVVNNANNGFGREIQVALFSQDWNEPPGPNDTGHINPTQNGTTYGDPRPSQNGLGETNPIYPFTLENLLGPGSPVISFDENDEPDGGRSFDVWCCPLDFQHDRYAIEINRDTQWSRTGETFPDRPIIWPTCLFRSRTWAAFRGDERVVQFTSWVKTAVDFTNYLNATYPFFSACHVALINDTVGWMNKGYLYDPAVDAIIDISGISDLWSPGSYRSFELAVDGVYRLNPAPVTLVSPTPFKTMWAGFIAESTADGLCVGFLWAQADNQDRHRTHWAQFVVDMRGAQQPPPTASPALYFSANTHRLMRSGGPSPKPRPFLPGLYGPYYHYLVVGNLATVRTKMRDLYVQQVPL